MDDIVDLVSRSDDDLRALVAELEAEEREISRRRRILHGKLDILRAELVMRLQRKHNEGESVISADDVEGLSRILAGEAPTAESNAEAAAGDDEDAEELACSAPSAASATPRAPASASAAAPASSPTSPSRPPR